MFTGRCVYIPCSLCPDQAAKQTDHHSLEVSSDIPTISYDDIGTNDWTEWGDIDRFCDQHCLGQHVSHLGHELRVLSLEELIFISRHLSLPSLTTPKWTFPQNVVHESSDFPQQGTSEGDHENRKKSKRRRRESLSQSKQESKDLIAKKSILGHKAYEKIKGTGLIEAKRIEYTSRRRRKADDNTHGCSEGCASLETQICPSLNRPCDLVKHSTDDLIDESLETVADQIFKRMISLASDPRKETLRVAIYLWWKERGWIVKSGLNFGVDFLIYERPPAEVHARFVS